MADDAGPHYEVYQSENDELWYWRLRAGNNEIIAQGEGYTREEDAREGIGTFKVTAPVAPIIDNDEGDANAG